MRKLFAMFALFATITVPALAQQTQAARPPSDGEILQIFMTMNQGEIITSQPALQGTDDDTKKFAQMMIDEHTAVLNRAQALAAKIKPQPNLVSLSLEQTARGIAERVAGLTGAEKDTDYMTAQVALHGQGHDMLLYSLIPATKDAELRALLTESRPKMHHHLQQARGILEDIMD